MRVLKLNGPIINPLNEVILKQTEVFITATINNLSSRSDNVVGIDYSAYATKQEAFKGHPIMSYGLYINQSDLLSLIGITIPFETPINITNIVDAAFAALMINQKVKDAYQDVLELGKEIVTIEDL